MRDHARRQRNLFEDVEANQVSPLPQEVQHTVTQLLVQWMQALAKDVDAEVSDEQDKR